MTIRDDSLLDDMFRKFGGRKVRYDAINHIYSTDYLRINEENVNDIMYNSGLFRPFFDLVNFLNICNISECVSSASFPKRCYSVDINTLCNFQKFDGDDCTLGEFHTFDCDYISQKRRNSYLSISNCENLDSVININANGDQFNLTLRGNDYLKRIHSHHTVKYLQITNCKSINDFSQIELQEALVAIIMDTQISSFRNCNTKFIELDLGCGRDFDFANVQNLKISDKLVLSRVESHTNILELFNSVIPIISLVGLSYVCETLNRYLDANNIPIYKRSEYPMDCMLEFLDAGITDVS